ncbi:M1-specific T cell receptor beta chain-like isoform X3 [Pempheris klunzingeri]|uniref:M1-specific T cell receptor beta chain-like isoform X3 n=1 Tax=Pempheris klunzingeri TaxID=3127111 RepID=UPI003981193D
MIPAGLIQLSAALLCLIDGSDVIQTPLVWSNKGQSATIDCRHTKDQSFFQMYWYRQLPGEGMKQIVFTTTTDPQHKYESGFSKDKFPATKNDAQTGSLTVKNLLPEDRGVYFCAVSQHRLEAYFGQGTKLTVLEPEHPITEPTVKVLPPSQKECRNQKDNEKRKTLVCVASEFYPDHVSVSWQIGEKEVTDGVATDSAALRNGKYYSITSRLRVSAEVWYEPSNKFICTVSFFINETTKKNSSAFIHGEKAKDTNAMTREKYLRITQSAKLTYSVFIVKSSIYGAFVAFLVWKLQGSSGKQNY